MRIAVASCIHVSGSMYHMIFLFSIGISLNYSQLCIPIYVAFNNTILKRIVLQLDKLTIDKVSRRNPAFLELVGT